MVVAASKVETGMEAQVIQEKMIVLGIVTKTGIVMEKQRLRRIPMESHVEGVKVIIKGAP